MQQRRGELSSSLVVKLWAENPTADSLGPGVWIEEAGDSGITVEELLSQKRAKKKLKAAELKKQRAAQLVEHEAEAARAVAKMLAEEKEVDATSSFEAGCWDALKATYGSRSEWEFIAFSFVCDELSIDQEVVNITPPAARPVMRVKVDDEEQQVMRMEIIDADEGHFLSVRGEAAKPSGGSFRESHNSETVYGSKYFNLECEIEMHNPQTARRHEVPPYCNGGDHLYHYEWRAFHDGLAAELGGSSCDRDVQEYKAFFEKAKARPGDVLVFNNPISDCRDSGCTLYFIARRSFRIPRWVRLLPRMVKWAHRAKERLYQPEGSFEAGASARFPPPRSATDTASEGVDSKMSSSAEDLLLSEVNPAH